MILSLLPIIALMGMLAGSVHLFGSDASYGPNQIALVIATGLASLVGVYRGLRWPDIQKALADGIMVGLGPMLILLAVGALIGSWILAGTVPAMIYHGVALLDPDVFYAASAIICALASLSIGSSWTVAGTLGIGLIGIAESFGLSAPLTAGAIISGAYFGDKLSPLSDTTNLAAACAGVDLFDHIRHMLWTTLPAFIVALLFFVFSSEEAARAPEEIVQLRRALAGEFDVSWYSLLPLLGMLALIALKVPAYPAILISAGFGVVFALAVQPEAVAKLANQLDAEAPAPQLRGVWTVLFGGYTATSSDPSLNDLLSKGGMSSMLNTIWLIITALSFGGVLERTGILKHLLDAILKGVRTTGDLVLATVTGGVVSNVLAADQFLAIALPGRMFTVAYDERGLDRLNLSRSLEDSATLTSVLVPWNTCGAYMSATLGVMTLDYLPYAVFNYTCPMVAIVLGYLLIAQKPAVAEASS